MENTQLTTEKEKTFTRSTEEEGRWVIQKVGDNRWKVYKEGAEANLHYEDAYGNIIK